ncbi:MAG: hypothetical protein VX589_20085 [Myxococcota bacterium]|nr:hypothetical protein [Myxococcota bacterium]
MALAALWSFGALFVWRSLMLLPLGFVSAEYKIEALAVGYLLATWLVLKLDSKLFKARAEPMGLWPSRPRWLAYGLMAGVGFTIVGSEIGNVGMKIVGNTIPYTPQGGPEPSVWMTALLGSIIHPICFGLIVFGVTLKTCLSWTKPWVAIGITCCLSALGAPIAQTAQLIFIAGLPAWLYVQTRSIGLAICAYLPASIMPLLDALALTPNIVGFDEVDPNRIMQQPIWFTLLGAGITIMSMWPLQSDLDNREDPS